MTHLPITMDSFYFQTDLFLFMQRVLDSFIYERYFSTFENIYEFLNKIIL